MRNPLKTLGNYLVQARLRSWQSQESYFLSEHDTSEVLGRFGMNLEVLELPHYDSKDRSLRHSFRDVTVVFSNWYTGFSDPFLTVSGEHLVIRLADPNSPPTGEEEPVVTPFSVSAKILT
jgi:hypothetical protein